MAVGYSTVAISEGKGATVDSPATRTTSCAGESVANWGASSVIFITWRRRRPAPSRPSCGKTASDHGYSSVTCRRD